ncbi:MAG: SUMF1/EgtB/PvdO family nonheme iron enzyme [Treponema sp.]|nr:SUMF1/EgtB/PvdO family nonheme iron enzyme [Treponema sp.]
MTNCLKCGASLIPGARFCSNCGSQIEKPIPVKPCPKCLSGIDVNALYCPWCGTKNETHEKPKRTIEISSTIPDMINIDGGSFFMGTGELSHTVELTSFKMSKAPITQAQYKYVRNLTPSKFQGDDLPVEMVDWCDAVIYCNTLSLMMRLTPCYSIGNTTDLSQLSNTSPVWKRLTCNFLATGFRLPTEAEWEYAARGGKKKSGSLYAGSDNIDEVAWYGENAMIASHPVCEKKPNALGLYDMCGNVAEWVFDEYSEYEKQKQINPHGPSLMKNVHVKRGGSWLDDAEQCNVFFRSSSVQVGKSSNLGFRVCCSIAQPVV